MTVTVAVGGNFGPRTNQDDVPGGGMLQTGGLTLAQPLTLGHQLVYRSDTVSVRPTVVVETSLLSTSSVPDSIDAQLTFGGVVGSTVSYTNTGLSAGEALRFALQVDGSSLATGWYDYTLTLTAHFGGSSYSRAYTGSQAVVNRSSSEFGKGWWLDGLDQLVISGSNALLVKGNGDALWFPTDGSGGYLKAAGDTSESTLVKNGDNTFTLTSKFGTAWNFGTTGLLTSIVDPNDNTIGFTYSSGKLSQIDDVFSRDTTFTYTSGYLTSFTDHASRTTTLTQTSGKLTMVAHPDPDAGGALAAPETDYSYDATTHLLTSTNDPLNYATSFSYNTNTKRLGTITRPDSTTWVLTPQQTMGYATGSGNALYDPADAVAQYVDERGKIWKFKTDRFGQVIYAKDPLNNVTTTERDHDGRPIRLTQSDPDGGGGPLTSPITKLGYSAAGDLVKLYQPDASVQTWTIDSTWHVPLTFTNELSKTWEFTYDGDGNRLTEEDPLGNTTTYTVTAEGWVETITTADPDGGGGLSASVTELAYDAYGRLEELINPDASTQEFTYTTADQLASRTDELSHVWGFTYDALDRLTSETKPDPDAGGSITAATTSYVFDASSRLIKITDALGNDTDYTYNNRNFLTQIQQPDPDGAGSLGRPTTTYDFNAVGQVIETGEAVMLSGSIEHTYNDAGWLTRTEGPLGGVRTDYTLDNLGRVTKATRADTFGDYSYRKYTYNSRGWVTSTIDSVASGTLADGPTTSYTFDAAGQLTGVTDPRSYTTAYAFNDAGWLTTITQPDPDGASGGLVSPVVAMGYDNLGRRITQTDPLGRVTSTLYDNRHRVIKVTGADPDGGGGASAPETEYAFDDANRLISVTDPLDRVTAYGYDHSNRLLTVTLPDPDAPGSGASSSVITYAYNKLDSITSITDGMGYVTTYDYDNLQRNVQITGTDPDSGGPLSSPVTNFSFNAQGLLAEITDALSHETTFGYDDIGRRDEVINHEGKVTATGYDNWDRVTSVTTADPDGAGGVTASATTYGFDRLNRTTSITDARSYTTSFTYDVSGNLTNLADANSNDTSWTYDGLGRVTQETNELSASRYFLYDAASNLIRKTDRNNRVTRYEYDNLNRLTSELWIGGGTATPTITGATTTQGGPSSEIQRVGVSATSMLMGGTFTLTFDGQTTSTIAYNATAATVKTALEALSNVDPDEIAVTKTSDTSMLQEWRLTFQNDLAGSNQPQTTIDATSVTYMGVKSEIEATDTTGGTNNEVQTITLNNTPTGGTFKLTFGSEQTSAIAYNATNSTVDTALESLSGIDTVTVTGSAGGPYTITFTGTHANTNVPQLTGDATYLTKGSVDRTIAFTYDVASQLTAADDPDSEYAYTYDNLGRVLTTSNSGTPGVPTVVLTSVYNANSQRTSLAASVGGTADFLNSYSYDSLNRQTRVDQTGNGGATVANKRVDFEYNAIGQFTEITRQYKPSSTWLEAVTSTYTYDTLNRITAIDHTHSTTNIANYDFTYDFMNRMSQFSGPDGTSDFTYDKTSQVTATNHSYQTDESNTYDATGNRTNGSYTVGTNNRMTSDGVYNYTYDNEGNRATRTHIGTGYVTTYEWDHRNRLIGVTEEDDMFQVVSSVEYAYDLFDRRLSKTIDADGAGMGDPTEVHYVYFGDNIVLQFDENEDLTHRYLHGAAVDQILADENAANEIHWPLPDHQGTIRDNVENDGDVLNHIEYGTFGNITAETNAAIDLIYGYTGRENDEETGQMHYRTRPYDAPNGKFTGEDRSGFAGEDPNLNRYVLNSAPNLNDPTGMHYTVDSTGSRTDTAPYGASSPFLTGIDPAAMMWESAHCHDPSKSPLPLATEPCPSGYWGTASPASLRQLARDERAARSQHLKQIGYQGYLATWGVLGSTAGAQTPVGAIAGSTPVYVWGAPTTQVGTMPAAKAPLIPVPQIKLNHKAGLKFQGQAAIAFNATTPGPTLIGKTLAGTSYTTKLDGQLPFNGQLLEVKGGLYISFSPQLQAQTSIGQAPGGPGAILVVKPVSTVYTPVIKGYKHSLANPTIFVYDPVTKTITPYPQ